MLDHDTLAVHRLDDDGAPFFASYDTESFRIAVYVNDGSDPDGPYYNALCFATAGEAQIYGRDLYHRWMGMTRFEVESCDLPVTHRIVDGKLFSLASLAGGEGTQ
jgi:hypothetical protein